MNFLNEDLHWFCGKRTFIVGGLYMSCNGGGGSLVAPSLPTCFCILDFILVLVLCWLGEMLPISGFFFVSVVSKDSKRH